jgi:IS605 OrfB family transposase
VSWRHEDKTVSLWVTNTGGGKPGRVTIPFTGRPSDLALVAAHRQGESDLIARDGNLYLMVTIDLPTPAITDPDGFIGVDLGIVQIAATARQDGTAGLDWSGGAVTARRKRSLQLRRKLQTKGTKSAKRLLKNRSKKESRFVADVNHHISKTIVTEAKRTGAGIAIEDLTGIRQRVRLRKPQRVTLHSWAFAQLAQFLTYKAQGAGVALVHVDPAYTSQQCSGCGHIDKKNRPSQAIFACLSCGISLNADTNAATNIAKRGAKGWAAINLPHAAKTPATSPS